MQPESLTLQRFRKTSLKSSFDEKCIRYAVLRVQGNLAMEGLMLYVSDKLSEIRFGKKKDNDKCCGLKELATWVFWRAVIAEFLGTMLFVFLGCASVIPLKGTEQSAVKVRCLLFLNYVKFSNIFSS